MVFRRLLTIPLIILFTIVFIVVLVISHVNSTAGNPDFYNKQLRQADVYNFIYDEVLPSALDDIKTDGSSDFPIDISYLKDEAVPIIRKILPPEWLQARTESAIKTIVPYVLGDTDSFTYSVALKDRVEKATEVFKSDVLQGTTATKLYDDGISLLTNTAVEGINGMPIPLSLSREQMESAIRTIVSQEWLTAQIKSAIDSVMPYMTGDANNFTITIELRDRVDPAAAILTQLASSPEVYNYILDSLITPMLTANFTSVSLPYGVSLNQEEIDSVVEQILPPSKVQAWLGDLLKGVIAYVKGEVNSIKLTLNLADVKAAALDVLTKLAEQKLKGLFNSLPERSPFEFALAIQNLPPNTLPSCRPAGVSYEQFKTMLNLNIASVVGQTIGDMVPAELVFTDADFGKLTGGADFLQKARALVTQGWTLTDTDLANKLPDNDRQTLEKVRTQIKSGFTITESDLRDRLANTNAELEKLDNARHWLGIARTGLWALWLIPLLFLFLTGVLGGRGWSSRLAWMTIVLFSVSLVFYIGVMIGYSNYVEPLMGEVMFNPAEDQGIAATFAGKGNEIIQNAASAFVAGLKNKALFIMLGSAAVFAGTLSLRKSGLRKETQ